MQIVWTCNCGRRTTNGPLCVYCTLDREDGEEISLEEAIRILEGEDDD